MKKIMPLVASIILILIAGIFTTAGTMAWFSDTETVSVGDINAGTLDLTVDDENPCTAHITVHNIAPGWSETYKYTLKNIGTITGGLTVEFSDITNKENGRNEPEIAAGDVYGDGGELGENLKATVYFYSKGDGKTFLHKNLNYWGGHFVPVKLSEPAGVAMSFQLGPDDEATFWLELELPWKKGNIVQSDSVEFDITFHLDQGWPYVGETS